MLTGYAYALQAAGFHVTSPARETLIVQPGAPQAAPGGERARQTRAREAAVAKQADRSRNHAVAHNARQPHQPAGQPNRDRTREPGTDPRASGTRAEPRPPADGEPKQQSQRSGEPTGEGTKDGPVTTAGQVPAPAEDQRQGTGGGHRRQLVTGGDRQAGSTFRSGDLDRTYQLLTGAPAFAPGHQPGADDRGTRTGGDAAAQPRPASPRTEKAPCPQCGRTYARPAGETYPCLSCESQARLKAAGFTAGSPEIQRAADWNRAVTRVAGHQPETPERRPESDAEHEAGPHIRTGAGPVPGGVKDIDREMEAGG
jgi:hypothetical protein